MPESFPYAFCIAVLGRPRGLQGQVHAKLLRVRRPNKDRGTVEASCVLAPDVGRADSEHETVTLKRFQFVGPDHLILDFADFTRERAESVQGLFLMIDPSVEIRGLTDAADRLVDAEVFMEGQAEPLGRVVDIRDNGAQPLLVLDPEDRLVPFVDALVSHIVDEPGKKEIHFVGLDGLF